MIWNNDESIPLLLCNGGEDVVKARRVVKGVAQQRSVLTRRPETNNESSCLRICEDAVVLDVTQSQGRM